MAFKKAERKRVKLKIALTGPSGAGKTYSALLLAAGIGGKIALLDTENESASLYSELTDFDTDIITPPYTIKKYAEGIEDAVKRGYDVLIIDSISHAWAGEGGLLEKKDALDSSNTKGSFSNWGSITKEHEHFKARILNADIHIICTMRSKQDYVLVQNDKGKQTPQKVGMAPVQRDGIEYEFTTVLDISSDNNCQASKDRTGLFARDVFKISTETGKKFVTWLGTAKDIVGKKELKSLMTLAQERGFSIPNIKFIQKHLHDIENSSSMTVDQFNDIFAWIANHSPEDILDLQEPEVQAAPPITKTLPIDITTPAAASPGKINRVPVTKPEPTAFDKAPMPDWGPPPSDEMPPVEEVPF